MGSCFYKSLRVIESSSDSSVSSGHVSVNEMIFKVPLDKPETVSSDSCTTTSSLSKKVIDESFGNNGTDRQRTIDNAIMGKYRIGMTNEDGYFYYTFWVPETTMAMQDFIEIHGIPIYEIGDPDLFLKYCMKYRWYNSGEKFRSMWESVRSNRNRITNATIYKFNIKVDISDCFYSRNGNYSRAYRFISRDKQCLLRAFTWFCNSLKPSIAVSIKQHHNRYFDEDIYKEKERIAVEYFRQRTDACGDVINPFNCGKIKVNINRTKVFSKDLAHPTRLPKLVNIQSNNSNSNKEKLRKYYRLKIFPKKISCSKEFFHLTSQLLKLPFSKRRKTFRRKRPRLLANRKPSKRLRKFCSVNRKLERRIFFRNISRYAIWRFRFVIKNFILKDPLVVGLIYPNVSNSIPIENKIHKFIS